MLTATAEELQTLLSATSGVDSKHLVKAYLAQINRHDSSLRAVISVAPEEMLVQRAEMLDQERRAGAVRGPLHGIPIIVKDNIATNPATGLDTTAGSLALVDSKPRANAPVVDRVIIAAYLSTAAVPSLT